MFVWFNLVKHSNFVKLRTEPTVLSDEHSKSSFCKTSEYLNKQCRLRQYKWFNRLFDNYVTMHLSKRGSMADMNKQSIAKLLEQRPLMQKDFPLCLPSPQCCQLQNVGNIQPNVCLILNTYVKKIIQLMLLQRNQMHSLHCTLL